MLALLLCRSDALLTGSQAGSLLPTLPVAGGVSHVIGMLP